MVLYATDVLGTLHISLCGQEAISQQCVASSDAGLAAPTHVKRKMP